MAHLSRGLGNYREGAELLRVRGGDVSQSSSKTDSF
jgi:hypothetical protein